MRREIDLNSDIGELTGPEGRKLDRAILAAISSCNIACGGHAGDWESMRQTLEMAKALGVKAGAHPSYPDREGFGRQPVSIPIKALRDSLTKQVNALLLVSDQVEIKLNHLKPHGALYNAAAKDISLAQLVCDVTNEAGIQILVGPPDSELSRTAERSDLSYRAEGFVDRAYESDGSLTPRSEPGAVLDDLGKQVDQAVNLAAERRVVCRTGDILPISVQTLCLHGDTSGAQEAALTIRRALEIRGFHIRSADHV